MRNKSLSLVLLVIGLLMTSIASAQDSNLTATGMRSEGKIYVVMTICLTILAGLIVYLIRIDRKIGKIEKTIDD